MASKAVMDAVDGRLAAAWTRAPIYGPNAPEQMPNDAGAFVSLMFPVADEKQITLGEPGTRLYREDGAFRVVLSVPLGSGMSPWLEWIDEIRSVFRGVVFDGVTTWEATPPAINSESDDGAYMLLSVAVPYQFDFIT